RAGDEERGLATGERGDGVLAADRALERAVALLAQGADLLERRDRLRLAHAQVLGVVVAVGLGAEQVAAARRVQGIRVVGVAVLAHLQRHDLARLPGCLELLARRDNVLNRLWRLRR